MASKKPPAPPTDTPAEPDVESLTGKILRTVKQALGKTTDAKPKAPRKSASKPDAAKKPAKKAAAKPATRNSAARKTSSDDQAMPAARSSAAPRRKKAMIEPAAATPAMHAAELDPQGGRQEPMADNNGNDVSRELSFQSTLDPIHVGISAWPTSPFGGGIAAPSGPPAYDPYADQRPLPESYGKTRLTLLVRDPEWVFAFWEINDQDRQRFALDSDEVRHFTLRVYDVTEVNDAAQAHSWHDVVVTDTATSWYLHVPQANRSWSVDLGYIDASGNFIIIARSNVVTTPRDRLSENIDQQWMQVDEESFQRLIQLSMGPGPLGGSEMLGVEVGQRIFPQFMLGASERIGASEARHAPEQAAPFHLQVRYELIVYGSTEADATVTLCGEKVRLRPDGTFTVRYELPDGERSIDIKAVKSTGDQWREASTHITKQSR